MRQRKQSSQREKQSFINSYHLNEVPLPYYNPLEDPFLITYFSKRRNRQQLDQYGMIFAPRRQYPYFQKRTRNSNQFLQENQNKVPVTHLSRYRDFMSKSSSFANENSKSEKESTRSPSMFNKKSESYIVEKKALNPVMEMMLRRPNTQSPKKGNESPDFRSHSMILKQARKIYTSRKRQNAQENDFVF